MSRMIGAVPNSLCYDQLGGEQKEKFQDIAVVRPDVSRYVGGLLLVSNYPDLSAVKGVSEVEKTIEKYRIYHLP